MTASTVLGSDSESTEDTEDTFTADDLQKFYGVTVGLAEKSTFPETLVNLSYQARSDFHLGAVVVKALLMKEAHQNTDLSALKTLDLTEIARMLDVLVGTSTDVGKGAHFGEDFTNFKSVFEKWCNSFASKLVSVILARGNDHISKLSTGGGDDDQQNELLTQSTQVGEALSLVEALIVGKQFEEVQTFQSQLKNLGKKAAAESLSEEGKQLLENVSEKLGALKETVPGWPLKQMMSASREGLQQEMDKIVTKSLGDAYAALRNAWTDASKQPAEVFDSIFSPKMQEDVENTFKTVKIILACQSGVEKL